MSLPPSREHVLFVCAPLFGYHVAIIDELESLGLKVTWWDDRASSHPLHKLGLRLLPRLFAAMSTAEFSRRLDRLDTHSISRVLVIKGEGMSVGFVKSLKARVADARWALYLWDSVENAPGARRIAPSFDSVATFDPVDAQQLGWMYRPLFAREAASRPSASEHAPRFDWSFVGTLHSDRYSVIRRLRHSLPGLRSYVYGYVPGKLLLAARRVLDWRLWGAPPGQISTSMMPAADVATIARESRAVLDVEHPRQRGLTMRTIETLLSQRKLITTNRYVMQSDLFDPSRVCVIDRDTPVVSQSFLNGVFKPIDESVRARYALRQWIADLIGDAQVARTDRASDAKAEHSSLHA